MKLKVQKALIVLFIICGFSYGLYRLGTAFAPGSYPYAERFELNYPEEKVISAINTVKQSNQKIKNTNLILKSYGLKDGRNHPEDHWYSVYLYNAKEKRIIKAWTRPLGNNRTTIAFVAVKDGFNSNSWKMINDDFDFFENRRLIKDFEENYLSLIASELKDYDPK